MSWQRVEKLSETNVQILCGQCVKEARILWSEQPTLSSNHILHIECHGDHRLVIIEELHVRIRMTENAPLERLQLTWESLHELDAERIKELRSSTADYLKVLHERLEHIDMVRHAKAGELRDIQTKGGK